VDRASYARQRTSSSTSSSTHNSHAADSAAEEIERQQDEMVHNLIQSHQHVLGILHVRVSCIFDLSNSI
jgi:hypothetical protein